MAELGDAVRELRDLVADERALFRLEMAQGVRRISLALGLGLIGRGKASLADLEPTRTGRQIKRDARILTERRDI